MTEKEEEKKVLQMPKQSCSPWRTPCWNRWIFLKDCGPLKAHAGAEEKSEKEGAAEKNHCMLTITPYPLHYSGFRGWASRGLASEEMKLNLGKRGGTVLF